MQNSVDYYVMSEELAKTKNLYSVTLSSRVKVMQCT